MGKPKSNRRTAALLTVSSAIKRKYSQRAIDLAVSGLWGMSLSCGYGDCIFGHPYSDHIGCKCHRNNLLTHLLMLRYLAEQLDVEVCDD